MAWLLRKVRGLDHFAISPVRQRGRSRLVSYDGLRVLVRSEREVKMGKRKLQLGNDVLQRASAGVRSEASYFARRCGLTTEEAVALMLADNTLIEGPVAPNKPSEHSRKARDE